MANKLLLIILISVVGFLPTSASAVIFASDALYLYADGKPVTDNSVIVQSDELEMGPMRVCEDGELWLRQGFRDNFTYVFIKTTHKHIQPYDTWCESSEGLVSNDCRQDYESYLQQKALDVLIYVKIDLPTYDESLPLETPPHAPIPEGMTGGQIGDNRYFRVDLDRGTIVQIYASQAPVN